MWARGAAAGPATPYRTAGRPEVSIRPQAQPGGVQKRGARLAGGLLSVNGARASRPSQAASIETRATARRGRRIGAALSSASAGGGKGAWRGSSLSAQTA